MTAASPLPFIVKVCGITNEEDAGVAADAGANAIGFNFYPKSPRFISLDLAHRIAATLPDSVLKVGVFVEPSEAEVHEAIDRVPLDVLQLHGKHVPSVAHRTWRALAADSADPQESLVAEAILLDSDTPAYGGSGRTFDWSLATRFWQPVILAGGLDANNVAEAIETARPSGVDSCSRLELSPGRKDSAKVRAFVQAASLAGKMQTLGLGLTPDSIPSI
ncbi:MAG: phosphoribosylanthranilate isomerase [Acidobacteriota bacterium]|nr:phosphoribosylanthranilate isomerase [Acidobacteriota bacterium]